MNTRFNAPAPPPLLFPPCVRQLRLCCSVARFRSLFLPLILLLNFFLPLSSVCPASGKPDSVDFRFAPARAYSLICFPADWLKSSVTESGTLGYDFGPGPYAQPLTEIGFSVAGDTLSLRSQTLSDPVVPIVDTRFASRTVNVRQRAFALVPELFEVPSSTSPDGRVRRIGGLTGCAAWAPEPDSVDPAFRNVAWGTNRPILYRVKVSAGAAKTVALGLCEPYKKTAGARVLDLRVEGDSARQVDPVAGGKNGIPIALVFHARDANRDGEISIEVHARDGDPNVILNAFWVFPEGTDVSAGDIVAGRASARAEIVYRCGVELEERARRPRLDAMVADFEGAGAKPVIRITSRRALRFDHTSGILLAEGRPMILSRPRATGAKWIGKTLQLELPEGTRHAELIVVHGPTHDPGSFPSISAEMNRSSEYWTQKSFVPKQVLRVPDPGVQYIIDASTRTMYQAADIVDGHFQFQPGASVYRGLWVGDVTLIAPQALMLGDTLRVRQYIEGILQVQNPDGQIRVIQPVVSLYETPMVMAGIWWYARVSGDTAWLRRNWKAMESGAGWIRRTRDLTMGPAALPYRGLMPPGFIDGGLTEPGADYGTAWWAMIGMEKAIASARWLGKDSLAEQWTGLFREMLGAFRSAARRDLRPDTTGVPYLPIVVADTSQEFPQRGQYAFLLSLRFGNFFDRRDPLIDSIVTGTLAMLDARREEGLIVSSGWLTGAVWSWLAGVHSLAHQFYGDPARAVSTLYAFANHATTLGTFVEEQMTRDAGTRTGGDASDAESAGQFVDAARCLIARERPDTLELFCGIPESWLTPGAQIEINNGGTLFGPLTARLHVAPDGRKATVTVAPVNGRSSRGNIVVSLEALGRAGFKTAGAKELPSRTNVGWGKELSLSLSR